MKAIHATPESIEEIFQKKEYIIPEYQRPYSWTEDQCFQLWEDVTAFYQDSFVRDPQSQYFLGNIVIYKEGKKAQPGHSYVVVDGQQRLISLQLLIKALHGHAGTYETLIRLLRKTDPVKDTTVDEPRIESRAVEDDSDALRNIIIGNNENKNTTNAKFQENYNLFVGWIKQWRDGHKEEDLIELITALLNNVVLLPIHCGSEDDAQTLFQTINDRGLNLSDVDIFKSILYSKANKPKKFMDDWKYLSPDSENTQEYEKEFDNLFRIQMHISRASEGDITKEQGLRSYFKSDKRLEEKIMTGLRKSHDIMHNWSEYPEADAWWSILDVHPNRYWQFPLFVFLHKYGKRNDAGLYEVKEDSKKDYLDLMEQTVKYFYTVGVARNTINAVRDTTFKVCRAIEKKKEYEQEYSDNMQRHIEEFQNKMEQSSFGRYSKGLVLIGAYLHKNQRKHCKEYSAFLDDGFHIEHILPKNWNNYDGWNQETHAEDLNKLGNLVPLEYKLNIAARNDFFDKKKERYKASVVEDAKDLVKIDDWTRECVTRRDKEIKKRISDFFIPQ